MRRPGPADDSSAPNPGAIAGRALSCGRQKTLRAAVFAPKGAVPIHSYRLTQKYKGFSLVSEATRAAALLEREELLTSEARHLTEASYRRRAEIEEELAEIRRLLERLGLRDK